LAAATIETLAPRLLLTIDARMQAGAFLASSLTPTARPVGIKVRWIMAHAITVGSHVNLRYTSSGTPASIGSTEPIAGGWGGAGATCQSKSEEA